MIQHDNTLPWCVPTETKTLLDLAVSYIEQKDPVILELEWFDDVTQGLSYPKVNKISNSIIETKDLMLFFKLVQMDILRSEPEEEHGFKLFILDRYVLNALNDRLLPDYYWFHIRDWSIEKYIEILSCRD